MLKPLRPGDIVAAYFAKRGYVGIGIITKESVRAEDFLVDGRPLSAKKLRQPNVYLKNARNNNCDFLVGVKWVKTIDKHEAHKLPRNLRAWQNVVVSLDEEADTLTYLEERFAVDFRKLLRRISGR